jgi:hypothetical protein
LVSSNRDSISIVRDRRSGVGLTRPP